MSQVEKRGRPAIAWVAQQFAEDAHWSANVFGCPELAIVVVPECFTNNPPALVHAMVDAAMPEVIARLTQKPEPAQVDFEHVTRDAAPRLSYEGSDLLVCWDEMNAAFLRAGWSDGLPLVPPTPERVAAMVAASGLPADHVVGTYDPGFGIGTVEKLAANAVMAGCKPAAMPVVLAVAECIIDPLARLRSFSMSTGPQAPLVLVSGPIAKEIGMNSGICALGPGAISQVNVSIGRALRLIMMNVGLSYPAVSDMDTIGTSMKFSACVAENEERNPWEPFRVTKGYEREASTVTINVPYGWCEVWDFKNYDADVLVEVFCSAINNAAQVNTGLWLVASTLRRAGDGEISDQNNMILLCPDHAAVFRRAGWSLNDLKQAIYRGARMPFEKIMLNKEPMLFKMAHPELQWLWDQPQTEVSLFPRPEQFDIFVVGGDAGRSQYHFGGGPSVTRPIKRPG